MRFSTALAVSAALLAFAAPASATTVLRVSVEKMALASDVILHGEVVTSRAVAVNGNPRHIRTDVVIKVTDLIKGQRGTREIKLELPGGKLGDWTMHFPGMPGFKDGEEVVLFLEKTQTNYAITGLSQGKFSVFTAKDGAKRLVRRNLDGLHFVAFGQKGEFQKTATPEQRTEQTVDALKAEIRQHLKQVRGR